MNNEENNWKEEFRSIGSGSVRFVATREEVISFIEQELTKSYNLGKSVGTFEEMERWSEIREMRMKEAFDEGYKKSQEDMKKALTQDE